jgi:hypothetical protein
LVVGKSSSRVNEEMGKVTVRKILDMTHEILLGKSRKVMKMMGRGNKIHMNGSKDHSR